MSAPKTQIKYFLWKKRLSKSHKGKQPWNKSIHPILICPVCKKEFSVRPYRKKKAKFCSLKCFGISIKGIHPVGEFKKGHHPSPTTEFKSGKLHPFFNIPEENHPYWKGNKVGYSGLHSWVRKHLGKPKICELCGKIIKNSKYIHWANKSGKYLRDLNDWLRLCSTCHRKYDNSSKIARQ